MPETLIGAVASFAIAEPANNSRIASNPNDFILLLLSDFVESHFLGLVARVLNGLLICSTAEAACSVNTTSQIELWRVFVLRTSECFAIWSVRIEPVTSRGSRCQACGE